MSIRAMFSIHVVFLSFLLASAANSSTTHSNNFGIISNRLWLQSNFQCKHSDSQLNIYLFVICLKGTLLLHIQQFGSRATLWRWNIPQALLRITKCQNSIHDLIFEYIGLAPHSIIKKKLHISNNNVTWGAERHLLEVEFGNGPLQIGL